MSTGQSVHAPAEADVAQWWQDRLDHDFPDGLLLAPDPQGPAGPTVVPVPRVEVSYAERGMPYLVFPYGPDRGSEGLLEAYVPVQSDPCLVVRVTCQDGPAYLLSNGLSPRLKQLLLDSRQRFFNYAATHGGRNASTPTIRAS